MALPLAVVLAVSCGLGGTEPESRVAFTRFLLIHRGEHLVLDAAAALLPDSTPANVSCAGAVTVSGAGAVLDSVAVTHGDAAQVFLVTCSAELSGVFTMATVHYTLYGPSLAGTWSGRGTVGGQRIRFEIHDVASPCANPWVMEDTDFGTRRTGLCVAVESTPDSIRLRAYYPDQNETWWRLEASRSAFALSEYRELRGLVWSIRITDPDYWAPYVVERN